MARVTKAMLDKKVEWISFLLDRPKAGWTKVGNKNIATVDALELEHGNGGYELVEVVHEGGGLMSHSPRLPAGQMADYLDAMAVALRLDERQR